MAFEAKTLAKLTSLLEAANGKRRKHRLTLEDVEQVVDAALASPHGIAVRHGGAESLAYTTLCLGVTTPKKPGVVVVGISHCTADKPTPGRCWKELQPWMQESAKNVANAHNWAAAKAAKDRVAVVVGAAPRESVTPQKRPDGGASLLREVLASPTDDTARRVYADHLMSIGDPRGELITVQLALASTPKTQVGERRRLLARERELLKKHGKSWTKEATQFASACKIRRGFVSQIEATCLAFATQGAAIFDREPIEELVLHKPNGAGLVALAGAPHLAKLTSLTFGWDPYWLKSATDVSKLHAFLRSPYLGAIPKVHLSIAREAPMRSASAQSRDLPDVSALFEGVVWTGVREFTLATFATGLAGAMSAIVESLSQAKLPALERLDLGKLRPADRALLAKAFPRAHLGA
ncbi:MAG: TIGR02996 domain-containing protein [Polyangiaceae bacterium]